MRLWDLCWFLVGCSDDLLVSALVDELLFDMLCAPLYFHYNESIKEILARGLSVF